MIELKIASVAQLVEHALRKRMVMGSIPIGGYHLPADPWKQQLHSRGRVCAGVRVLDPRPEL